MDKKNFSSLKAHLLGELEVFLRQNPMKDGINREELKGRLPKRSDGRFFHAVLAALEKDGKVQSERELVKLPGRNSATPDGSGELQQKIAAALTACGSEPPSPQELALKLGRSPKELVEHLHLLSREGMVVKVKGDLFYAPEPLAAIREQLTAFLREHKEISPNEFRELTGLSRKFMIPLLEYFDQEKLTIRVGDKRLLRRT